MQISRKKKFNFLIVLLPAFLLQLSAELLVAQEIRYEQNTLIRIDSLSSGVVLKPEASSAPDFISTVDGIPFSYEFKTPEGLLRIQEMLRGCQECVLAAEDSGYTIEEIGNVLRKLLAERGLLIDQKEDDGSDSSVSLPTAQSSPTTQNIVNSVDQLSLSNQHSILVDEPTRQRQPEEAAEIAEIGETETSESEAITATDIQVAPLPPTPQVERESLEEMIARVRKDFLADGRFTDQRVQFAFDSYELLPGSFQLLNAVGSYIMDNPNQQILITGNTCTIGPLEYNYQLSELRAESVAHYLLSNYPQIDAEKILTEGHGPDNPIVNNDDPEVRYLNRRVEFIINERDNE